MVGDDVMKRNVKSFRRISILMLSFMMVFTMVPVFGAETAADEKKVNVDEALIKEAEAEEPAAKELTLADGTPVDVESIPAEEVASEKTEEKESKTALKKTGKRLAGDAESWETYNDNDSTFRAIDFSGAFESIQVGVPVACTDDDDENYVIATFKFVPETNGKYLFYTNNKIDTYGRLVEYDPETGDARQYVKDGNANNSDDFMIAFTAQAGKEYYLQSTLYYEDHTGSYDVHLDKDEYTASIKVSLKKSTGKAVVTGTVTGDEFDSLYVDGSEYSSFTGAAKTINMRVFNVGLHTIYATLKNHDKKVYYAKAVPTYIYGTPSNKLSYYTTGPNYFSIYYSGNTYKYDYTCDLMLDYRLKGKKWKNGYGPFGTSKTVKRSKLKSAKKYQIRTYFAKKFTYGGKKYIITGKQMGKTSKVATVKTGGKKLKIKSIKISKVKVTSKMVYRGRPGYIWDPYYGRYNFGIRFGYEKETVTQFKITVKLKKKPNAKGIMIGNQMVKGNKKKYTKLFTLTGNQKGKKLTFSFCSYQNGTYKGYSKLIRKKKTIK